MPASAPSPLAFPPSREVPLAALRERVAAIGADGRARVLEEARRPVPLGHAGADAALGGGLARGGLHELHPAAPGHEAAATGFALACLARLSAGGRPWLWVRQDVAAHETGEPYGPGLACFGLDPSRLRLVAAADARDVLRAAEEGLRCAALAGVLVEPWGDPKALDLTAMRRLVLAAEASGVAALVLRSGGHGATGGGATRWLVSAAPSLALEAAGPWPALGRPAFQATLLRCRQTGGTGEGGRWIMEWSPDERRLRDPAAPGGGVVSAPRQRPPAPRRPAGDGDVRRAG
jgi:protein ImuA